MTTTFSQAATLPSRPPAPAGPTLHQWNSWQAFAPPWRSIQLWAERRAQRDALLELANQKHLLEDIGLTRSQVIREAARPFWRA